MDFPTAHALLRDRHRWRGSTLGVAPDDDSNLVLAQIPAPTDGKAVNIATSLPYTREVSGIAAGPCQALFVADTAHDRLLWIDGQCNAQAWLPPAPVNLTGAPGTFKTPRALACAAEALLVADSGNARIQSLAFPQLEANLTCTALERAGQPGHRLQTTGTGHRCRHEDAAPHERQWQSRCRVRHRRCHIGAPGATTVCRLRQR